MVKANKTRKLQISSRTINQSARLAIRDIFDAIVELVTNADDRYQILRKDGVVEIEVTRHRKELSTLCVRDFADGMTAEIMDEKLSKIGGRVSGMESGHAVRGTNSRGAKDVAALGRVTFESIGEDGKLHKCSITPFLDFEPPVSNVLTQRDRKKLKIGQGTGTVVTIEINREHRVPNHGDLVRKLALTVSLRDIITMGRTTIFVYDLQNQRKDQVVLSPLKGKKCLSERFSIPGYPGAEAKFLVHRANEKFEQSTSSRFRRGGFLIKSRHAVHEATLFEPELEKDSCATRFYGRLTCEMIDQIWNEYDDYIENRETPPESNPRPVLDPSRRGGLIKDHPFTKALYSEALKRFRPLVDQERRREQKEQSKIENSETRRRLNALQKAANKFMSEYSDQEEDDLARDPNRPETGSRFQMQGYAISPPYTHLTIGQPRCYRLSIIQEAFPDIEAGDAVQIECLTDDVQTDATIVHLEPALRQEGVLQVVWKTTAMKQTSTTGIIASVGPIAAEAMIEVLATEAEKYAGLRTFQFERKQYRVRTNSPKRINLLAPLSVVTRHGLQFTRETDQENYRVIGPSKLTKKLKLGIAKVTLNITAIKDEPERGKLLARLGDCTAETKLLPVLSEGAGITIKLEDVDLGGQRYRWRKNVLEIAARHQSLARYIGSKSDNFPGQDKRHFRVLLAEIVADAICSRVLERSIATRPEDYENADWNLYYAEFSGHMNKFLPIAHKLIVPDTG